MFWNGHVKSIKSVPTLTGEGINTHMLTFLGARAPLELAHVKNKNKKKKKEKVLNSDKLLSPASTCTLILDT